VGKIRYDRSIIEDIISEALEDPNLLRERFQPASLSLLLVNPTNNENVAIFDLWYKHIPILFEFLPSNQDVRSSVRECLRLSFDYLYYKEVDFERWKELKKHTHQTKKSKEENIIRFRNHAKHLVKMLKGLKKEQGNKLQKMLLDAINNPYDFLPNKTIPQKSTTEHIKKYLQSLQIKTEDINSYLSNLHQL